ncbi:uncharacterized protein E5676_scaffold494G00080 [Cucumis melo var. makuwa]|uniref:Uncharacterized protein n=1 Tax=Cucumis melo var. makuwa TaxID=1194695 RepID=A0A5D3DEA2_CUCMM|nr:uncharacterized protein E5676_scaffold494G00080 [Cucumis melo var. makuwa]
MVLEGHHKFRYLTGEIARPRPRDPQECIWKGEDSLLQSQLISSKEPQIEKSLLYTTTARGSWVQIKAMDVTSYLNKLFPIYLDYPCGVKGHILEQKPIAHLMEVCSEVHLEEDRVSAMNIKTVFAIDSTAFSTKLSGSDNDKHNWKHTLVCEHCKKPWHTKVRCWKSHRRPPNSREDILQMTSPTLVKFL